MKMVASRNFPWVRFLSCAILLMLDSAPVDGFPAWLCPGNGGSDTANSRFQYNLNRYFHQQTRPYAAGLRFSKYNNGTLGYLPDQVYALFFCRGDVAPGICQSCIDSVTYDGLLRCPGSKEAIMWSDVCYVRYSSRRFFSFVEIQPTQFSYNPNPNPNPGKLDQIVGAVETFKNVTDRAASDPQKYAKIEVPTSAFWNLSVQCTPDLSEPDCSMCLSAAFDGLSRRSIGKQGGRALLPSCSIHYELAPSPRAKGRKTRKIVIISSTVGPCLVLFIMCAWITAKRPGKLEKEKESSQAFRLISERQEIRKEISNTGIQGEKVLTFGELPPFQLDTIRASTKNFSVETKLGEGGFGPVFKGTLPNGEEIAVKKLSRTSGQGLVEFKNEINLIARLQHKNLIRLLGYCLEDNEKILIYEYMPNKSLDVFLFDSNKGNLLDWKKRVNIISGIARGLLYLHEDSCMRIIHRDLKASNILLDREMNPKISDFGMARNLSVNQDKSNTNRVVGTYGYMSPEYAMGGFFSVKSDVFSFGVLLLETISGKKNNGFHLYDGESLLTFAWKLWYEGRGLELTDPSIKETCDRVQVLKCIHIGLLCVQEDPAARPTMSLVVHMVGADTITLPHPSRPAFSVGRRQDAVEQTNNVCTVNELTVSDLLPR